MNDLGMASAAQSFGQSAINQSAAQYNNVQGAPNVPPPTTIMEAMEFHGHSNTYALLEIAQRLEGLKARVFGGEPANAAGAGTSSPSPDGAVHRIAAAIQPHESLLARIRLLVSDLERIA